MFGAPPPPRIPEPRPPRTHAEQLLDYIESVAPDIACAMVRSSSYGGGYREVGMQAGRIACDIFNEAKHQALLVVEREEREPDDRPEPVRLDAM